ncbi:bifunctional anthranilate synthase component II/anthranilate phosphoribosyltransferase [Gracilinema caldarium]|uniref:Anthranilate phosphoribosyltransferase n=1 Tax=Gracilinema caldarium (strain ATCC 51460 / DSM 7334 / H1) TaxID=744872 RepID=F8EWV7_GRAC1|nr:bifunctional anthranilate synthase component II/anthranilate phosphoribosyltransferase [Gracilinema caldarium]AEJ18343.1 Anthranilate phosphoribosyltransferase [Gracilinema caldarium DSM 7334]
MIVIIDNYDSFTYNLYQYFARLSSEAIRVIRNDEISLAELEALEPSHLVISPGPGRPEDAGISVDAIRHFAGRRPILGVCLGHQAIGYAFGSPIVGAKHIRHGEVEDINLDGKGLFRTIGPKGTFTRYHSLVVAEDGLSPELEISARSNDGDIMGLRHRTLPIEGIQFHPESVASIDGEALIRAFLNYRREPFAFKRSFEKTLRREHLSQSEAEAFMEELTEGSLDTPRIAAMLTALSAKGPSAEEIAGCAAVLRRKKTPFLVPGGAQFPDLTDTCGTGGDGLGTFNISSMAALVAASCGLPIAKHGNRAVSSRSGSADFYEALGIPVTMSPAEARTMLSETNFVFLFAPVYHGAMRFAAPARKALGIKTLMNLVGPLSNPADAAYQVIGVYDEALLETVARAARILGVQRVLTVHSRDGMDEISPSAPTDIVEMDASGAIHRFVFDPAALGLGTYDFAELAGADARHNAALALDLIAGAGRPALEAAVAFNSGAALYVAGRAGSIAEGAKLAADALASGAVAEKLEALRCFAQQRKACA